jgi:hypothetical protein
MKKKIGISMGVIAIIAMMFMTLGINVNSSNKHDVSLENIKALACYTIEDGSISGVCCEPWYNVCYMVTPSQYLDGKRQ